LERHFVYPAVYHKVQAIFKREFKGVHNLPKLGLKIRKQLGMMA
jgi:hypothetical protein